MLVSCSDDKTIQIHDLKTSKLVQLYNNHGDSVRQVSLFGDQLISVADDS
jgi:WD40 repeat protein